MIAWLSVVVSVNADNPESCREALSELSEMVSYLAVAGDGWSADVLSVEPPLKTNSTKGGT